LRRTEEKHDGVGNKKRGQFRTSTGDPATKKGRPKKQIKKHQPHKDIRTRGKGNGWGRPVARKGLKKNKGGGLSP